MIIGTENLLERLGDVSRLDLNKGIRRAALLVQEAAKLNAGGYRHSTGELRGSIGTVIEEDGSVIRGIISASAPHAVYVEFGTGPRGFASHSGISPDVAVSYTMEPWWIHEGEGENEIGREEAEAYGFFYIDTPSGRFYLCSGQPAKPFLYPALKDNEEAVLRVMRNCVKEQL